MPHLLVTSHSYVSMVKVDATIPISCWSKLMAMLATHSGRHATPKIKPTVASSLKNRVSHSTAEIHAQGNMDRGQSGVGLDTGGVSKRGAKSRKGGWRLKN